MNGELVRSLPDRPLYPADLQLFDEHNHMEVLAAEGEMPSPAAHGVVIQTEDWYYGLGYEEHRDWHVFKRLDRTLSDGRERIEAAFDDWLGEKETVTTDRPF